MEEKVTCGLKKNHDTLRISRIEMAYSARRSQLGVEAIKIHSFLLTKAALG